MTRGKYRSYSLEVKAAIVASRNPKLFPNLSIPKSTAQHWIRSGADPNRFMTTLPNVSQIGLGLDSLILIIKCLGEEVDLSILTESEMERLRMAVFSNDAQLRTHLGLRLDVVAIDIIHFWQKKLVDALGSLKIERSSLILRG